MTYLKDDDLWACKYVDAKEDDECFTVPHCSLCGLPCDDVLRYGDEGCRYTKGDTNEDKKE